MLLNDKPSFHPSFDAFVQPFPSPDEPDTGKDFTSLDETLVNVVDLVMGVDGVLWVLDLGVSNTLDDHPSVIGDPKVVGFDANTGTVSGKAEARTGADKYGKVRSVFETDASRFSTIFVSRSVGNRSPSTRVRAT